MWLPHKKKNFFIKISKIEGMTHKTTEIIELNQNYIKHTKKQQTSANLIQNCIYFKKIKINSFVMSLGK